MAAAYWPVASSRAMASMSVWSRKVIADCMACERPAPPVMTLSFQPWKWPLRRRIFSRPVAARETRAAIMVASVPEEVKRTFSAEGSRRWMAAAHWSSRSVVPLAWVPRSIWRWTAATRSGWAWPKRSAPWPIT